MGDCSTLQTSKSRSRFCCWSETNGADLYSNRTSWPPTPLISSPSLYAPHRPIVRPRLSTRAVFEHTRYPDRLLPPTRWSWSIFVDRQRRPIHCRMTSDPLSAGMVRSGRRDFDNIRSYSSHWLTDLQNAANWPPAATNTMTRQQMSLLDILTVLHVVSVFQYFCC